MTLMEARTIRLAKYLIFSVVEINASGCKYIYTYK